jgi:5'-AMP-activated protein kinase catalytic alpha subunit
MEEGKLLKTPCGSPCYAAPEMISGKRYSGDISDLWSVGIILYVMLCGFLPFDDENNKSLYKKILSGNYEIPPHVSDKARDLIKKLLTIEPSKRINIKQIKEHSWFNLINYKQIDGLYLYKHIIPVKLINQ